MKSVLLLFFALTTLHSHAQSQEWIVGTWGYCCLYDSDSLSAQSRKVMDYQFNGSLYAFYEDSTCFSILSNKRTTSRYEMNAAQDSIKIVHPSVTYTLKMKSLSNDSLLLYYANTPIVFIRMETSKEEINIEDIER